MPNRFPHIGEVLGAAPARLELAPVLSPELSLGMSRQRDLLDLQAIQRIPGLVGYWKADPAYLFEDSAGTTPASTSGTGIIGSWYGVNAPTYGPNLVSNGAFDTDTTGWTAYNGSIAQENGELKLINGASAPYAYTYTPITTEVGGTYVVTATCHSESANNMVAIYAGITPNGVTLGSDTGDYTISGQALETLSFAFIASGTTTYIGAGNRGLANAIGYLDNVTVNKVLSGRKAIQTTTANKPILRKTPTTGVYWADSNTATSMLTVVLGNLGSSCTVARATPDGVKFAENVSITSTYNIAPAYDFSADIAIFDRALTAIEKALITRYMARAVPLYGSLQNAIPQMRGRIANNETVPGWSAFTSFQEFWRYGGNLLTSFQAVDAGASTNFYATWMNAASLVEFPLLDMHSATNLSFAWYNCSNLISFPAISMPFGANFNQAWRGCTKLAYFPASFFDAWVGTPAVNCFVSTWTGCTALTQTSLQNIVVSIANSDRSAPATGTDITLDGAPTLATMQADTTFMTAVTTLKARNWIPTYKGTAL